ncbi:MAG: hypothetical protein KDA86_10525 [Planctomycetaceae bacterium]|nr:hypothetical protein [Planctomycetaceae bacterium]
MRRFILMFALLLGLMGATPVHACPMCKYANENNQMSEAERARPKAYMYSILFMLAMPMTLATGYGVAFYRMSKKQQELMSIEPLDDGPEIV